MLEEKQFPILSDMFGKIIIFFVRTEVILQWLTVIACLVIGWLLSKLLWNWLHHKFPKTTNFFEGDKKLSFRQYLVFLLGKLDFPLISLILVNLSQIIFRSQHWTRGILSFILGLLFFYMAYLFLVTSLYAAFPFKFVRQYHLRLLAPLFFMFILAQIISINNNLEQIAQISPFKLFNSPVSLKAIFWLTAGLYFWITIVILLENSFLVFLKKKNQVESATLNATFLLMRYFMIALGIVLILGYVGVNGAAVAAITGGLSVGIGFGLKEVISNFISGIILLFEGVLKPGDTIDIEGKNCEVTKLGIRATTVRMLVDNSERIIPNQTFFTSDITTYTGSDRLIYCSITVGVGYNSNVRQVSEVLLEVAREHPRVLKQPSPVTFLLNFGDSSLNFELKFWLDDINSKKRVISDISCAILDKFTENKIEIPFPQRDIHLRSG